MNTSDLCVVFDLDDTLYLERDYVRSGFQAVGGWCEDNLKLSGVQDLAQSLFDQGKRTHIFDVVLEKLHAKQIDETVAMLIRVYREHAPKIQMPADAVECLAKLYGRVHLGLLTDGHSVSQWAKIAALGLKDVFDEIVVTGDWGPEFYKPNPRGFQHIEANVSSSRFMYIADNPMKDFLAPRRLRWGAVRVNRPASLHHSCPSAPEMAAFEIGDLTSVADYCFNYSSVSPENQGQKNDH
jgi:putative hydrolase of the HAD superfamily